MPETASVSPSVRASASSDYSSIEVRPIPGPIGAEIICGDVTKLTPDAAREVRRAWLENLVLLVRSQALDDAKLLQFAGIFGDLEKAPVTSVGVAETRPDPYIAIVSNIVVNGVPIGSLGNDEAVWHTDMSHIEAPPAASVLHAREITDRGGETGFLNMYHALETLPEDLRRKIDGRTLSHDGSYNSAGVRRRVATSMDHPMITTHPETGHDVLFLGRRPHARINGLSQEESDELLDALWKHATHHGRDAWHHSWGVGDMLIWDNRCCMHHRNAFDANTRRLMHRGQTQGTRPAHDASHKPGRHPRSLLALN